MTDTMLHQWQMTETDKPFALSVSELPEPKPGEALVKVAGCGVCHTDLSFWHYGVNTKSPLPLTLGHEISGTVMAGPESLLGKPVLIPAVLPCGECKFCTSGRSNICRNQLMPGNDFHGGFASHIVVPARFVCPVPEKVLENYSLEELAVIADAISTPYQVVQKSELESGDLAIVIGVGGVGIYGALLAKIAGAKVIALDINDVKLQTAKVNGVDGILNIGNMDARAVKEAVKSIAKTLNAPAFSWKIFEMSGTASGQDLAFNLLTFGSTISIVGFTMQKVEVRLSNLMAFDAKAIGTWGCRAELYPEVLELVATGKLDLKPFVQIMPMSQINEVFEKSLRHVYTKRIVLKPDFDE